MTTPPGAAEAARQVVVLVGPPGWGDAVGSGVGSSGAATMPASSERRWRAPGPRVSVSVMPVAGSTFESSSTLPANRRVNS